MYHNESTLSGKDIVLIAVGIMILCAGIYWFASPKKGNETLAPVSSEMATLGQQLIFPRGWHLASSYAYAFQSQGPYIVYICQKDTNSSMYRICTPKTVEENNGN